jgi:predicted dehydrogenase
LLLQVEGVVLKGIADPAPEARTRIARSQRCLTVADYRELIGDIDAAVVATPTALHHSISAELLRQGIHVLVEKPITRSVTEAQELTRLAAEYGRILQVGHVERFNPAFASVQAELHRPRYIEATRNSGYTCRSIDVGAVMDLMIHDIDLVLSLADSDPVEVHAVGAPVVGPLEDMAHARIEFANGCVANLAASRVSSQPARTMNVWEHDKSISIDFANRSAHVTCPDPRLVRGEVHIESMGPDERLAFRDSFFQQWLVRTPVAIPDSNALLEELREFTTCVRTGQAPRIGGKDATAALSLAHRIIQKIQAHRWSNELAADSTGAIPFHPPSLDPRHRPMRKAG